MFANDHSNSRKLRVVKENAVSYRFFFEALGAGCVPG